MSLARFGVTKPVPVNLLMAAALIAGAAAALTLQREFFPEAPPDSARVVMRYPGATPEEVEQGLAIKVEDALYDLDDVDELTTTISEGGGGIVVKFREGLRNYDRALSKVEREVESLTDLPDEAERLQVIEFEPRLPTIMVSLYGDADERTMKQTMRSIEDDLKSLRGMGDIALGGMRGYEIRVDVDYAALMKHGISLPQVADAISGWMRDIPGGSVRTGQGNVNVRTLGVEDRAAEIRRIVVRGGSAGQSLRVSDIAEVRDTFVDDDLITRFNGRRSMNLTVFKVGEQDAVGIAEAVRAYVAGRRGEPIEMTWRDRLFETQRMEAYELGLSRPPLPGAIAAHSDLARFIEDRLDLLFRNALYGAMLVFGTLLVFLNWRVAVWVGVGLTTAMAGTLVLMSIGGVTLNLLTMFGLIVVLGLLVDDAIVVAENVQARHDRGEPALVAAIRGTDQVFWPVVATILTSVVAFLPLMFIEGRIGVLMGALPLVVACALLMSLIESVLILPSHMGHSLAKRDRGRGRGRGRSRRGPARLIEGYERWRDRIITQRIVPGFGRLLERALAFRYISVAAALAILIGTVGIAAGGRVTYTFLSSTDSETIIAELRMPIGTSIERTNAVVERIERAAEAQPETRFISATVGQRSDIDSGTMAANASHIAQLFIELEPVEQRDRQSSVVIDSIRRELGTLDEVERLRFSEITGGPGGPDITVEVRGEDERQRLDAVARVKEELAGFDGVHDIADDNELGQREIQITVRPGARTLGFDNTEVSRQVRGALFGIDAHVFAADREDIDVRVRADEQTRRDLHAVENLWLISPAGSAVPLREIARLEEGTSYSTINRIDRQRTTTVTADTSPLVSPEDIVAQLPMASLQRDFPGVEITLGGRQQQQADAFRTLPIGFAAALIAIYVILAWLFSSYVQPLAVMLAIPFGIIGVIWGHLILGYDLTFLSMIGFVALSGIIVNDSLILIKFANTKRAEGMALRPALVEAGMQRFRPIFLTTVTTVLGLTPLMLEQSFQARFLIPMAIAIAFGLMAATMVILIVLPSVMVIIDDAKAAAYFLWNGQGRPATPLHDRAMAAPPAE